MGRLLSIVSVLLASLLAVLLAGVAVALARRITEPIAELGAHARRVAHGDFSTRVRARTNDELGELAADVNEMATRLEAQRVALEEQVESAREQARKLELLSGVGKAAISAFDLHEVMQALHANLRVHVHYDGLAAAVFEQDGNASLEEVEGQVFCAGSSAEQVRLFLEELTLGAGRATEADVREGPMEDEPVLNHAFGWFCVLPLWVERGLVGATVLARREATPLTASERNALTGTAQILALAVKHIRLFERSEDFARELERQVAERTQALERSHERLLSTERHAATGRLAAGIAHEINNPLGIIKNYLKLVRREGKDAEGGGDEALTVIDEELDRIARIVRNLLDFYRPPRMAVGRVDVNEELRSLISLMEGGLRRHGITVQQRLEAPLPAALMPPDQFRQVMLNLMRNAEDAMRGGGGTLTVSTLLADATSAGGASRVKVEVADTGCGISADDRQHLFEPFFTTKGEGHGTGLGLAVSFGIVRNAGGTIDVESTPGRGSRFTVNLRTEIVTPDRAVAENRH